MNVQFMIMFIVWVMFIKRKRFDGLVKSAHLSNKILLNLNSNLVLTLLLTTACSRNMVYKLCFVFKNRTNVPVNRSPLVPGDCLTGD